MKPNFFMALKKNIFTLILYRKSDVLVCNKKSWNSNITCEHFIFKPQVVCFKGTCSKPVNSGGLRTSPK